MDPVIEAPSRLPTGAPESLWIVLVGLVVVILFGLWVRIDATTHLSRTLRARRSSRRREEIRPERDWQVLYERAERIVEDTITALPDDVKAEAVKLPCLFRERSRDLHGQDALGVYQGFEPGAVSKQGGSIVLFLGDIDDYCAENELDFEQEVRMTYLHELGHHLGWDEKDLENRGL